MKNQEALTGFVVFGCKHELTSSLLCFSALLTLSDGAMSPTMHSAMS